MFSIKRLNRERQSEQVINIQKKESASLVIKEIKFKIIGHHFKPIRFIKPKNLTIPNVIRRLKIINSFHTLLMEEEIKLLSKTEDMPTS